MMKQSRRIIAICIVCLSMILTSINQNTFIVYAEDDSYANINSSEDDYDGIIDDDEEEFEDDQADNTDTSDTSSDNDDGGDGIIDDNEEEYEDDQAGNIENPGADNNADSGQSADATTTPASNDSPKPTSAPTNSNNNTPSSKQSSDNKDSSDDEDFIDDEEFEDDEAGKSDNGEQSDDDMTDDPFGLKDMPDEDNADADVDDESNFQKENEPAKQPGDNDDEANAEKNEEVDYDEIYADRVDNPSEEEVARMGQNVVESDDSQFYKSLYDDWSKEIGNRIHSITEIDPHDPLAAGNKIVDAIDPYKYFSDGENYLVDKLGNMTGLGDDEKEALKGYLNSLNDLMATPPGYIQYRKFRDVTESFEKMISKDASSGKRINEALKILDSGFDGVADFIPGLGDGVVFAKDLVKTHYTYLAKKIGIDENTPEKAFNFAKDKITHPVDTIKSIGKGLIDTAKDAGHAVTHPVDTVKNVGKAVYNGGKKVVKKILSLFS